MPAQSLLAEAIFQCYMWFFEISAERIGLAAQARQSNDIPS